MLFIVQPVVMKQKVHQILCCMHESFDMGQEILHGVCCPAESAHSPYSVLRGTKWSPLALSVSLCAGFYYL